LLKMPGATLLSWHITRALGPRRVVIGDQRVVSYVSQAESEVAKEAAVSVPICKMAADGISIGVRAYPEPGSSGVRLEVSTTLAELLSEFIPEVDTQAVGVSKIQNPQLRTVEQSVDVTLRADGGGVLLGPVSWSGDTSSSVRRGRLLVLVRAFAE
jgi:hypothetical protein